MKRKQAASSSKKKSNGQGGGTDTKKPKKGTKSSDSKSMVPCDKFCPKSGSAGIFCDNSTGERYACALNQTNIEQNNNKFMVIQVLKDFDKEHYYAWIRWGRVGYSGLHTFTDCGNDVKKAISIFEKKFSEKTKNSWDDRTNFIKVPGKYDLVQTDVNGDEEQETAKNNKRKKSQINGGLPECSLELAVEELIRLICDVKTMEAAATDIKFDTKKNPLGKISDDQIRSGYVTLSQIAEILKDNGGIRRKRELTNLSSQFYTRIPHCTGMRAPPVIDNDDLLSTKVRMLEVLGDIKLGMDLLTQSEKDGKDEKTAPIKMHPIDRLYKNLKCDLSKMAHGSNEFSLIKQYIISTHATTHMSYSMDVQEVYTCNKDAYLPGYKGDKIGNRMLLFHGSRLSNWAGILSQGLRIAPPEAPVSGYMFGKGVYFADMSSKSANYCFTSRSEPDGLLLLCEVALGNPKELVRSDCNAGKNIGKGKHSVKGCGSVFPQPQNFTKLDNGTVVPLGPGKEGNDKNLSLDYNEYIVYDTKQIRLRYIAKIKFNFK